MDFGRDVLPALRANCLPCHNKTVTKGDLVLETPGDMRKGGETGPAVVPGRTTASLLYQLAIHQSRPHMPPRGNKVNASDLLPEQLGRIAQWIDQGARASVPHEEVIGWQPLPASIQTVFAVAVAANGRYAACGKGNRLEVRRLADGERLASPADPTLGGAGGPCAHQDEVNALAFSPDGEWLASGGFREVKLWRKTFDIHAVRNPLPAGATNADLAFTAGGRRAVSVVDGAVILIARDGRRFAQRLWESREDREAATGANLALARSAGDWEYQRKALGEIRKEVETERERVRKARDAYDAAARAARDKEAELARSRQRESEAAAEAKAAAAGAAEKSKKASALEAKKFADQVEDQLKPLRQKRDSAGAELELAAIAVNRAESTVFRRDTARAAADEARAAATRVVETMAKANSGPRFEPALAAAFTGDGRSLVALLAGGRLRVWSSSDGEPLETIALGDPPVCVVPGPGASVLARSASGRWRSVGVTPTWALERRLGGGKGNPFVDRVTALAFAPDGRLLAVGGGEPTRRGDLSLWDVRTGAMVRDFPALHTDSVLSVAFAPDGERVATGGADRFARVVEIRDNRKPRDFEGHAGHVLAVGWALDGHTLATGGADLRVKIWDPDTGEKRKEAMGFNREVCGLTFVGGQPRLVAAAGEGELRVLDFNGERVAGLDGPRDFTYSIAASADGAWIVAGGQEGVLRAWHNLEPKAVWESPGVDAPPSALAAREPGSSLGSNATRSRLPGK